MLRPVLICLLLSLALHAMPASAETTNCTNINSLPVTISTQGVYCLKQNLSTGINAGAAITINTSNVTIDCNDWKIGGLAAGADTDANGVYANARSNITIRNCGIRGFRRGLWFPGSEGGYHLIENNRFDLNTSYGIQTRGDGTTIRGNRVYDTGGSTIVAYAYGIDAWDNADVIDNAVSGVYATPGQNGGAVGIISSSNEGGEVSRNRVSGLIEDGAGSKRGIWANGGRPVIRYNTLISNIAPDANDYGIACNSSAAVARENIIIGYGAPALTINGCTSVDNTINF
ncbi:right-handed parallel beta-helix repeat-containing protein [Luteimonas salinilitoris]|uniref:Right-handed parallel beta-helix repeat-containing protein n=1 Tax=Luteimonas salinilitoris TaxID=3237697 RepID=A0ABV4HNC2_9GAMM